MYEVGTSVEFTAWHVMPGMEGPEGELHSHDYRIDLVVTRGTLDDRGMVVDLDVLKQALVQVVSVVDGKDLDIIRPPEADAVTVEVVARWTHEELSRRLAGRGPEHLTVRVYEDEFSFGGYSAPVNSS